MTRRECLLHVSTLSGLLPASGVLGANDRIQMGVIGVGGMGSAHLKKMVERRVRDNISVEAVCDVYSRRLNQAKAQSGAVGYTDYRRLLDRNDIDAVLIATPDHWHASIALDALEAGKHVYVEKPMTHTIDEALAVRDTVRRLGSVLQVGPQRTAYSQYSRAAEMIAGGCIGKVTWASGGWTHNLRETINEWYTIDESAGPYVGGDDHIDWDMWLGHGRGLAPRIPWNPDHFFRFRKYFRYNGGVATDLLYHYLAPLLVAITGREGEYPIRVNASGGLYVDTDGRDTPDMFVMNVDYPSGFTMNLVSTYTNFKPVPPTIYGTCGTVEFQDEWVNKTTETTVTGNGDYVNDFMANNDGYRMTSYSTDQEKDRDLMGNFLDAIRYDKTLCCGAELGCAVTVATCMAVQSYRQSRTLVWDERKEEAVTA